mmetsp:Transcript_4440/g.7381  ORF Transcript_4440/g.7381 Transcript_4440/m.7381 type:complete len:164 (-) Transcript_4440:385-876(-)|eukprot:CAMPEP_0119104606 /NCGR_PEP_ID=MMETSP1180-20130426/2783_1 /TAXON_ID=3052 ORGANISM="Chlamydomonas cf sp, Strain CCMP681" /NCGR_SAMPLE_ID=MMETSP1180 /ASSEMBLY_ACC=CAM_ASM_000741 /LENGTH=163 /DNA_ID=CAMNT_0007089419 /DNA_START=57 /DNA_END=548 /DNA_ORIENTATION=+
MAGPPQHGGDLACRVVFLIEIAVNLLSVALMCRPASFYAQFVPVQPGNDSVMHAVASAKLFGHGADGFMSWYVVLLLVLTYGSARSLISYNNQALAVIQEAMLLGDILHLGATFVLTKAVGGWTQANYIGCGLTAFYAAWRIYFLVETYQWLPGSGRAWYSDY